RPDASRARLQVHQALPRFWRRTYQGEPLATTGSAPINRSWRGSRGGLVEATPPPPQGGTMVRRIVRCRPLLHVVLLITMAFTLVAWAGTPEAASASLTQGTTTIDPSDPRLVPNPIESSDPGTVWSCRVTGSEGQCTGTLAISWEREEGPGDWCAV